MENSTLIYDAKCGICRDLAHKIQFHARTVEIRALSDPEATRILEKFYPDGWSHDFYVIDDGVCRKGFRALPKLLGALGTKRFVSLLVEYASLKISRKKCEVGHRDGDGNGAQPSRRDVLKYTALSALLYPLSAAPKLESPFNKQVPQGFVVHVSEVEPDGRGGFVATASRCDDCLRPTAEFGSGAPGSKLRALDEAVLRDIALSPSGSLKIRRTTVESERVKDGAVLRRVMSVHNALLDQPRFNVVINVGKGPVVTTAGSMDAATISGMIGHDLPAAMADFIVVRNADGEGAVGHLAAILTGLRELRKLHAREGRGGLAQLFEEIERGLTLLRANFEQAVSDPLVPIVRDRVVITSLPEILKFVQLPSRVDRIVVQGCACTCSCCCGCWIGCGCGCGCGTCGCVCGCGCCVECACGCGCGCGCDLCA